MVADQPAEVSYLMSAMFVTLLRARFAIQSLWRNVALAGHDFYFGLDVVFGQHGGDAGCGRPDPGRSAGPRGRGLFFTPTFPCPTWSPCSLQERSDVSRLIMCRQTTPWRNLRSAIKE